MGERQLKLKAKSPVPLVGRCIESIVYFIRQSGSSRLSGKETGIYQGKICAQFLHISNKGNELRVK